MWLGNETGAGQTCNPEVAGSTLRQVTTLGKLFSHMCLCSPSSIIWYQPHRWEHNGRGVAYCPYSGVVFALTELCLHSLSVQGLKPK